MITLSHISKWISNASARTFILKDIGLSVKEGEFISIMGPSGSGKSTLLNVIGMLDEPSEGEYYFMDQAVHTLSLIHISEPTRLLSISCAVFCLKKKNN